LILALDAYRDALLAEIVQDCSTLSRLRSAAARLEWAADPVQLVTGRKAA
jgi:hypothetical protein